MNSLGIDQGGPGAAVLLNPAGQLLFAGKWKATRKGWLCTGWFPHRGLCDETQLHGRDSAIGEWINRAMVPFVVDAISSERAFLHKKSRNVQTVIDVTRAGTLAAGPLASRLRMDPVFVEASTWRHTTMGLNIYTTREVAKKASLKYLPLKIPGLSEALERLGPFTTKKNAGDHITDAAGIALWRQITARYASLAAPTPTPPV